MKRNERNPRKSSDCIAVGVDEAAAMLGISPRMLRLHTKTGRIPSTKLGGRVLYSVESLRELFSHPSSVTAEG